MPWGPEDAKRHTKKAKSAKAKRQFSHVANSILERTGDEGRAIRGANAAVAKRGKRKRGRARGR
jgi:hypothetical protein